MFVCLSSSARVCFCACVGWLIYVVACLLVETRMNGAHTAADKETISSTIDNPAQGAHQRNEETLISNTFQKMNEKKNYAT